MKTITAFWRGQLGFAWTVVLLVGLSMVLANRAAHIPGWAVWPFVAVLACLSVWQTVGAVRFGERLLRDGALSRVYGIYAAMGVALISNILVGIGILLPAPPVDLTVTGYVSKVSIDGAVAHVDGEIEYQILTELKAATQVREVWLNSTGGNVQAGRAIGLFAAEQGMITRVDDQCFSACTLVFAGGRLREMGANGVLGFHGYRFEGPLQVQTIDKADIEEKDRVFFEAQGFEAAFVKRIFATPPEDLWKPSRAELVAAGVLR